MKITPSSILSFSAIFAACLYAASVHAASMPGDPHLPPKEAVEACAGKNENDACSFIEQKSESVTGACRKGPDGKGMLACVPTNRVYGPSPTEPSLPIK